MSVTPLMIRHENGDGTCSMFRPLRQEYLDSGLLEVVLCEADADGTVLRGGRTVEATENGPGFAMAPYCYASVRRLGRRLLNEVIDQGMMSLVSLLPRAGDMVCPLALVDQDWLDDMGDYGIVEDYM